MNPGDEDVLPRFHYEVRHEKLGCGRKFDKDAMACTDCWKQFDVHELRLN
jgi:hypothetical protein